MEKEKKEKHDVKVYIRKSQERSLKALEKKKMKAEYRKETNAH